MRKAAAPQPAGGLAQSMQRLEELSALYELARACYLDALESWGQHAPSAPRILREELRDELKRIRSSFAASSQPSWEQARQQLDQVLERYGRGLEQHIDQSDRDVREIMAMVATLADSLAAREKQHQVRFRGIAKQLRLVATATDLAEIRRKLAVEVEQLERYLEDMARDTQQALHRIRQDLQARQQITSSGNSRVSKTGGQAAFHGMPPSALATPRELVLDPTTELPTALHVRQRISDLKRQQARFCLARFTIPLFEELLAQHGRAVLEAIVKEVAQRLQAGLPPAAWLARWSPGEFLMICNLPLPDLVTQLQQLEEQLKLTFAISGKSEKVAVCCRTAAVESLRSETAEEMIRRAFAPARLASGQ